MAGGKTHILEVWGDFACFSRPELKVERWSYPCPTPSAARGIFDAIYCKGWDRKTGDSQFYWQVEKIELLSIPNYIALRRNEVGDRIPANRTIKSWALGNQQVKPIVANESTQRQQRQTMAIRNPHYLLYAHIVPRDNYTKNITSYDQQFIRRAMNGKCFQQPYFGCKEFHSFFKYIECVDDKYSIVQFNQDIGYMLYDVYDLSKINDSATKKYISIFKAEINQGTLNVPSYKSEMVLKP